jgi:hypothetical protein
MESLELDMRLAGHFTHGRHWNSRRTPTLGRGHGIGKRRRQLGLQGRREKLTPAGLGLDGLAAFETSPASRSTLAVPVLRQRIARR